MPGRPSRIYSRSELDCRCFSLFGTEFYLHPPCFPCKLLRTNNLITTLFAKSLGLQGLHAKSRGDGT
jgi:hypothetical protein